MDITYRPPVDGLERCTVPISEMPAWFFWTRAAMIGVEPTTEITADAQVRIQVAFENLRQVEGAGTEWWMTDRRKMA
jgi:hypothetical protein